MNICLSKFGSVLTCRSSGSEAYKAVLSTLSSRNEDEDIIVDFDGVTTFSHSWGDEFLTSLQKQFGDRLILKNTKNPSIALTIAILERVNGSEFKIF